LAPTATRTPPEVITMSIEACRTGANVATTRQFDDLSPLTLASLFAARLCTDRRSQRIDDARRIVVYEVRNVFHQSQTTFPAEDFERIEVKEYCRKGVFTSAAMLIGKRRLPLVDPYMAPDPSADPASKWCPAPAAPSPWRLLLPDSSSEPWSKALPAAVGKPPPRPRGPPKTPPHWPSMASSTR
jgi:hypothetical protein